MLSEIRLSIQRKKMQFQGRTKQGIELNIAPLIDVVFLLLIFFMLTSSVIKDEGIELNLPSSAASTFVDGESLTVSVNKEGDLYFNSKEISAEELKIALTTALKDNPDSSIILKSDNQLEVQKLISVMDLIKESGGVSISIATKIEATKGS